MAVGGGIAFCFYQKSGLKHASDWFEHKVFRRRLSYHSANHGRGRLAVTLTLLCTEAKLDVNGKLRSAAAHQTNGGLRATMSGWGGGVEGGKGGHWCSLRSPSGRMINGAHRQALPQINEARLQGGEARPLRTHRQVIADCARQSGLPPGGGRLGPCILSYA